MSKKMRMIDDDPRLAMLVAMMFDRLNETMWAGIERAHRQYGDQKPDEDTAFVNGVIWGVCAQYLRAGAGDEQKVGSREFDVIYHVMCEHVGVGFDEYAGDFNRYAEDLLASVGQPVESGR